MAANNTSGRKKSTTSKSRSSSNASGNRNTRSNGRSRSGYDSNVRKTRERETFVNEPLDPMVKNEIILLVVISVCVVLFLCNFGIIGTFGNTLRNIMFGIFGMVEYVLPLGAIIFTLFRVFNSENPIVKRKLTASVILCLLIMMMLDMLTGRVNADAPLDIAGIYERCAESKTGGGVIAGVLAYFCAKFLSVVGTWLLILVLACVCVIMITGKSLFNGIKEQGQIMYADSREESRYRKEQNRKKREEKRRRQEEKIALKREMNDELERDRRLKKEERENEQILRMDRKASGVSFDTTLSQKDVTDSAKLDRVRDDEHPIQITSETEYKEKETNSAVIHTNKIAEASDAIREISMNYDSYEEDIETEDTEMYSPQEDVVTGSETYQVPIHTNGYTIGADNSSYGAGGKKPEASYSSEVGNSIGVTSNRHRVTAHKTTEEKPSSVTKSASETKKTPSTVYRFPPIDLLTKGKGGNASNGEKELRETADKLQKTLEVFGVSVKITDISRGPAVTRYEMQPELGVKVSKIVGLADDLKLSLAATDIRIEAPIPGKSAVGIEVPNKENEAVAFRDLVESKEFKSSTASLPFAVGKDIAGQNIIHDIAKMPHVLIAGSTGSGKSVCINTIIMSILYKCKPEDVKLIMIDPKVVELSVYNGIPHLLLPVVTDPKKAAGALGWAVKEMTDRYAKFADTGVRDLKGYNAQISDPSEKMPHILIIVDELADLMMVAPGEVEEYICRLAQLARACGIHLVIATQRPSVDVITGLIKANMPSRVAFAVSSGVDSRTILDMVGAEKLLGKGDMLFYPQGLPKPSRVQGAFVPDSDVSKVVDFLKNLAYVPANDQDIVEQVNSVTQSGTTMTGGSADGAGDYDPLFAEAGRFIVDKQKASIGALQRLLKIGFNRAARIMDQLAAEGVVGEEQGTKPREILMETYEFEELLEKLGF